MFVFVLQFFMKATQLEQMREDFVYIKTTKHVTEDKVEQHSEVRLNTWLCHSDSVIKVDDSISFA